MDFEELLFPLGVAFLACSFLSLVLIYFSVVPYAIEFPLFVASIFSLVVSVVLVALHFAYTWPMEEPWRTYSYHPIERSLEHSENHPAFRTNLKKAKAVKVATPTREELQLLKEVLGISQGSLQFKKRGQGIYLVIYNNGKHVWTHLGRWNQLKEKLQKKKSPQNEALFVK